MLASPLNRRVGSALRTIFGQLNPEGTEIFGQVDHSPIGPQRGCEKNDSPVFEGEDFIEPALNRRSYAIL